MKARRRRSEPPAGISAYVPAGCPTGSAPGRPEACSGGCCGSPRSSHVLRRRRSEFGGAVRPRRSGSNSMSSLSGMARSSTILVGSTARDSSTITRGSAFIDRWCRVARSASAAFVPAGRLRIRLCPTTTTSKRYRAHRAYWPAAWSLLVTCHAAQNVSRPCRSAGPRAATVAPGRWASARYRAGRPGEGGLATIPVGA